MSTSKYVLLDMAKSVSEVSRPFLTQNNLNAFSYSRIYKDERHLAAAALGAATSYLGIKRPLLYGRVDVVRDSSDSPMVLELEICEPSLNLPYSDCAAALLVQALTQRLENLS